MKHRGLNGRIAGDLPMRRGEILSLTVTLPNKQRVTIHKAVVRGSRGQEFAVKNVKVEPHTQAWLTQYVRPRVQEPAEIDL